MKNNKSFDIVNLFCVKMALMTMTTIKISWPKGTPQKIINILSSQIKQNKLSHAYLFYGPGKKIKLAKEFAKILLCQNIKIPCRIGRCCRMFEAGTHPEFILIKKKKKNKKILISQIREIIHLISLSTAYRRIILIKGAELLTPDAANALLKTLEEPVSNSIFILTAESFKEILPTVISRCQGFYVPKTGINSSNHDRENNILEFLRGDLIKRFQMAKIIVQNKEEQPFIDNLEVYLRSKLIAEKGIKNKKIIARDIKHIAYSRSLLKHFVSARIILEDLALHLKK